MRKPTGIFGREKVNKLAAAPTDLISYIEAKNILAGRFRDITAEEIAIWVFLDPLENNGTNLDNDPNDLEDYAIHGMDQGGIKSYFNNETERKRVLDIYNRATVGKTIGWDEILRNMYLRRFSRVEINSFTPPDRWISYDNLLTRWSKRCSKKEAEAIIDNKLDKDAPGILRELTMSYPVSVMDQTKEVCMYSISEIEAIEQKEFPLESIDVKVQDADYANEDELEASKKSKPWFIHCEDDPKPELSWYTPARYFARELVVKDSTLLTKRNLLAKRVVASLKGVGIYKRGRKLPFNPATVLKAFTNVNLG